MTPPPPMDAATKAKVEKIAGRLETLAAYYLQHTRLDGVKPADLATHFQFEARELRNVAEGKPTH